MDSKAHPEDIDLRKYWLVLKRRWLPASGVLGLTVVLTALFTSMQDPVYEARGKLLFRTDRSSTLTGLESQVGRGQLDSLSSQSEPLSTQAEVIRSRPIAEATVEALGLTDEAGEPLNPQTIAGGLNVRPVSGTDVLGIAYQSDDPELAAAIVNQVMEEYRESNILSNREEAAAAREFIKEQLPQSQDAVRIAEADLRQFKEANGILVLQEEASAAVTAISGLDRDISQAQAALADSSARADELRRKLGMSAEQSIDMSSLSQSLGVQEALVQLQEVQSELAVQLTRYRPGHPAIASLERREAALTELLQGRVGEVLGRDQQVPVGGLQVGETRQSLIADFVRTEVERMGLSRRVNQLTSDQAAFQSRSSALPGLEQTQRELERQLSAAQTTYETLLNRLQEIQVAENQTVGNARVISAAEVPGAPIAPRKQLNMAAGSVVGLLLAIAAAFLIDLVDRSVKTVREARDLFGYPLLGVIPTFGLAVRRSRPLRPAEPTIPRLVSSDAPHSSIWQAYQMLQANLKFLKSDGELRTIVITSSVKGEGKSEVAANLAAAMAHVGRRVLLIDADLRHPAQHHIWDLTNMMGLSNVIVGQANFGRVVQQVMPTLHVLTAGVIPPNPMALLGSQRMAALLESCAAYYDCILIDTPAMAGAADAPTLGKMTDGILLVVRPGVVDSGSAATSREFLAHSDQTVLGLVANGVIVKNEPDSYFYYKEDPHAAVYEPRESGRRTVSSER